MKRTITDFWPDWVIGEVIGEGVNGIVCRAWKRDQPDVQAAVKVFEKVRDPERLRREIQSLQQLKGHPSIVAMDDFAVVPREDGGRDVYLRMELLTPLRDFFANRSVPEEEICRMGIQLCEALSWCHQKGILHGDIKPGNILVDSRDSGQIRFKLADFSESDMLGRAEVPKQDSFLSIYGTMDYIAPEAEKGHPEKRSDLYSLGLTLYRYLNRGNLPFLPERRIQNEDDRRVSNRIRLSGMALPAPADASAQMAEVILKACAFHPEDRYASAEDFAAALRSVLSPEKKHLNNSRHRWLWPMTACLVLIICGCLFMFGRYMIPVESQADKNASGNALAAVSARDDAEAAVSAESADALPNAMSQFHEAFTGMNPDQIPESISDFPLVLEAWRFAPRLQAEDTPDAWLLRTEEKEKGGWSLRAENAEDMILSPSYDPEQQAWVFTPDQRASARKLVASQSFSDVNIDYDYDPESMQLTRIALWTQSPDGASSLQFNINGQGEPEYFCILRSPAGLQLAVYGPDGLPVPEETSFTRLENRLSQMNAVWKERFEPALRANRFCFPAAWQDVPFVVSREEAPTAEIEEKGGTALIHFSEHVPTNWHVLTGKGIPVSFTPCSWDPEAQAWKASVPFDRIQLSREAEQGALTVQIDYERGAHFLPNGPVVFLEDGTGEAAVGINCYLMGSVQANQGGVFCQVCRASTFYAFYDDQGKLDHYNNDQTGCVYGVDGIIQEGTEPADYVNPVVIGLP